MRNYDEDGRPATQPDTRVYSEEPEIKKEPELSRKPSNKRARPIAFEPDTSDFSVLVETKPGRAWTEPEPQVLAGRKRAQKVFNADTEPFTQVETKTAPSEIDTSGVDAIQHEIKENRRRAGEELNSGAQPPVDVAPGLTQAEKDTHTEQMNDLLVQIQYLNKKSLEFFKIGHQLSPEEDEQVEKIYTDTFNLERQLDSLIDTVYPREIDPLEIEPIPWDATELAELAERLRNRRQEVDAERGEVFKISSSDRVQTLDQYVRQHQLIDKSIQYENRLFEVEGRLGIVQPEVTGPDGRVEPTLGAEPLEVDHEEAIDKHGTAAENRGRFKEVMAKAAEKFGWYKSSDEKLIRRNAELDAQLEKIGGVEKGFRWLGEKYNKLGWKSKLAIGASLGLGAALTAGTGAIAIPLALIAGQRIAGLSTMYLKFEKNSHQEKWGKEKAMLKAGVYTVLMGLAMKEAIEYASGTELAHAAQAKVEHTIQGWLGTMLGHKEPPSKLPDWMKAPGHAPEASHSTASVPTGTGAVAAAANEGVGAAAPTPDIPHPAAVAGIGGHQASADVQATAHAVTTGEAPAAGVAAEVAPTAPEIASVEVQAGKGYEYTMKRLLEKLPKDFDKTKFLEGSDMRRLLDADPKSVNDVLHDIAKENRFFNANETNVRIDVGAQMSVDADGDIFLGNTILAPEGAHVTPPYHPEAPAVDTGASTDPELSRLLNQAKAEATSVTPAAQPPNPDLFYGTPPEDAAYPPSPNQPPPPGFESHTPVAEPTTEIKIEKPEGQSVIDITEAQRLHEQEIATNTVGQQPTINTEIPPPSSTSMIEHLKEWINPNKVPVDPLHGGVYKYPNGVPVGYGKGALDAAQDFAKATGKSAWVQSETPVLYEGKLQQYVFEVKYGGFWRGIQILGADGPSDPSQIITIDPDAFVERLDIKK